MTFLSKKIIIVTIIFLFASLCFFLIAYKYSKDIIERSFYEQTTNIFEVINTRLNTFEKERFQLINTLVKHEYTKDYILDKNNIAIKKLFYDFAKANPLIMQLRLISLNGDEFLKLEQNKDLILFKKKDELQNKAHRYYFKKFLKLEKNQLGISNLDLNMENNKIQIPFKSTVRFAMPIFIENEKKAILVINYSMNEFLANLLSSSFFTLYLVDKNGYFIIHEDKKYNWSEYTKSKIMVNNFFKTELANLYNKQISFLGNEYYLIYDPKDDFSIKTFVYNSKIIGALGVILLVVPFMYMFYLYLYKLKSLNLKLKWLNSRLKDTKNQIELILNHTSDTIILINDKGLIKEINIAIKKTFGYERDELLNKNVSILIPQPHYLKYDEYIENYNKDIQVKGISQNRELFGLHKDGSKINIELIVTKVKMNNENYFIGNIRNLSNEFKSKKLFENVFNSSSVGIGLVLQDGSFWRLNKKFCSIVEYSNEELIKLSFQDITHKDDLEKDLKLVQKILNREIDDYTLIKRYISKTGRIVWIKLFVAGVYVDEKKEIFDYFIATIDDITSQIESQNRLKETQQKLIDAEKIAQIGHWFWNIEKDHFRCSENMLILLGVNSTNRVQSYEEFISNVYEEDKELFNKKIKDSFKHKSSLDIEHRIVVGDKIRYLHTRGTIKYDENNKALEFLGTCQDITQLKILELEKKEKELLLMQQSKLASMGEMIGSIAHQWRQPLNSIGFIVQDMISAYKHNEFDEKYLYEVKKELMDQLNYMSETIDEFRNFFKKDEPLEKFNLINTVLEVHKLYKAQLNANHLQLEFMVEDESYLNLSEEQREIYIIKNQESQLKQVLINCISNAKEAILNINNPSKEQQTILIKLVNSKNDIKISISDLAGGVLDKDKLRIFEPYFTTKNMGTGLGLYICKTICEKSLKGSIDYEHREVIINNISFKGSTFIIKFPKFIK